MPVSSGLSGRVRRSQGTLCEQPFDGPRATGLSGACRKSSKNGL